jgi:hypothetical protein
MASCEAHGGLASAKNSPNLAVENPAVLGRVGEGTLLAQRDAEVMRVEGRPCAIIDRFQFNVQPVRLSKVIGHIIMSVDFDALFRYEERLGQANPGDAVRTNGIFVGDDVAVLAAAVQDIGEALAHVGDGDATSALDGDNIAGLNNSGLEGSDFFRVLVKNLKNLDA